MPVIWGKLDDKAVERIGRFDSKSKAQWMPYAYAITFGALPGQRMHGRWKLWVGKEYPIPLSPEDEQRVQHSLPKTTGVWRAAPTARS